MLSPRLIAALYLLFGLLAVPLVAGTMPPFQHADEPNHAYRADQVSRGRWLAEVLPDGESGGFVASGLIAAHFSFDPLPFRQDHKVAREMYTPRTWGGTAPAGFPNTAIYPPLFYAPASAALAVSRALDWPVLRGVVAARMATGFVSVAVGALAIALSGEAAVWLFAVLTLPMSLSLAGAVSQDAPMLAAVALAVALLWGRHGAVPSLRALAGAALLLMLAGMARPPLAALGLVFLAVPVGRRLRVGLLLTVVGGTLIWGASQAHLARPLPGTDAAAQLYGLLHAPWRVVSIGIGTIRHHASLVLRGFIGQPGWLDVDLPRAYHLAAWAMLGVAGAATWARLRVRSPQGLAAGTGVLASLGGMALIQYLTWTPVGAQAVEGLQGRYFLAPALMLAALPSRAVAGRWAGWCAWPVVLFPLVTIPVLIHAVLLRYYF